MKQLNPTVLLGIALVLSACSKHVAPELTANNPQDQEETTMTVSPKAQVRALLESIETGAPEPVAYIDADSYTQHNLAVADGLAGFGAVMAQLPEGSARARVVRVFQDGDYVFAHTDYDFFGPKIGFDVFRFEGGKIVEHWDNLQQTAGPNPSGRTMTDGPTEATDLARTTPNKELVRSFLTDVLVDGKFDTLPAFFGAYYHQHNPQIADELSGLQQALGAMAEQGITMEYHRVHNVLGEGNFVLAVSEGRLGGVHTSFYDLFRIEDGKIVEHWDTIEPIALESDRKNDNGKFGF